MSKRESAAPVWERVSKQARMGSDRKRGLYVAARRLAAPGSAAARTLAALRTTEAGVSVPADAGFAMFPPDRFPESHEVVTLASKQLASVDPETIRDRGKPFMVPILDQSTLTRESPLVRLALRDDVLRAVTFYLRVAPILSSIELLYSRSIDRELMSSQLLHCDGDDTRQVKIFVLCTRVLPENGPLMIMRSDQSQELRRKLSYEYRNRVTDEEAAAVLPGAGLTAVEGEPATTCLVDTSRCFHYGSRVQSHDDGRLVAMIQYLTPYSFMLPRDARHAAPYARLATGPSSQLERFVLGAV